MKIGIIGVGHLGEIHLKQWLCLVPNEQIQIYDTDTERAKNLAHSFNVSCAESAEKLMQFADVLDIVTPTQYHFQYAQSALEKGKSIFIEKPVCYTLEEALALQKLQEKSQSIVQIGHVERFNPAFADIQHEIIAPKFFEIHRLAPFNPRGTEVSVIMDLMIHDIDIVLSLVSSPFKSIEANGVGIVSATPDICNARVVFENGCVANLTASRISMKKMRKMRIFSQNMYVSIDFLEKDSVLYKILDGDSPTNGMPFELNDGTQKKLAILKPDIAENNAIYEELKSFKEAVEKNLKPKVPLQDGIRALELAFEIQRKIEIVAKVQD